ncbi:DNA cytosine methyltransferase [Pseudoxanthomonas suwonensis]|uniref:DNA cytosine methyltransferase n=1 Tax=Pseudoxanthomonas suwonensis TaxID=314722 RepID=UPI001F452C79|nr:DNA cytosine methyltransferase [Pseudoxanthomonas suwonensis]
MAAGWQGLFGVECHRDAFKTLSHNLLSSKSGHDTYSWPEWLEQKPWMVSDLISKHEKDLLRLRGSVDAVVGGPPCQGFSTAGKRRKTDARNQLYLEYLKFVEILQPRIVLLENVKGITIGFPSGRGKSKPTSDQILAGLTSLGYVAFPRNLCSSDFGVAQRRNRFFLVGVRAECLRGDPYELLEEVRADFLAARGLRVGVEVGVADVLSDLEIESNVLVPSVDTKGFQQVAYKGPKTNYQRLLNGGCTAPDGLRIPRHGKPVVARNRRLLRTVRRGVSLNETDRAKFGMKKAHLVVLDPKRPAPTLTTLPDDLIHYSEPRVLTVRESARLQSFPDWYSFQGPYTTGGNRRRNACPKYTQVGNAVSPWVAECLGKMLAAYLATPATNESHRAEKAKGASQAAQGVVSASRSRASLA